MAIQPPLMAPEQLPPEQLVPERPEEELEQDAEAAQELTTGEEPGEEPDQGYGTPERQIYEEIVAGLIEFMYGKGKEGIAGQLQASSKKDFTVTVGKIAFTLVNQAIEQAHQANKEIDMDIMLAVTADIIDSLIEMSKALKIPAPADGIIREQAMIVAAETYVATTEPGSEERAAAEQMMQQMGMDGTMQQAASTLSSIGKRAGTDPFAASKQAAPPPETEASPLMQGA